MSIHFLGLMDRVTKMGELLIISHILNGQKIFFSDIKPLKV